MKITDLSSSSFSSHEVLCTSMLYSRIHQNQKREVNYSIETVVPLLQPTGLPQLQAQIPSLFPKLFPSVTVFRLANPSSHRASWVLHTTPLLCFQFPSWIGQYQPGQLSPKLLIVQQQCVITLTLSSLNGLQGQKKFQPFTCCSFIHQLQTI